MYPRVFVTCLLTLSLTTSMVWGDAAEDLTAGKTAVAKGDYSNALPLLSAAVQGLPQSVEARLALAECHLQLGDVQNASAGFQAVLKLSKDHARAKQMVSALSASAKSFDEQLRAARTLLDAGLFNAARSAVSSASRLANTPMQHDQVKLVALEATLMISIDGAAIDALTLAQSSSDPATVNKAKVIAALSLVHQEQLIPRKVQEQLAGLGELDATWTGRANLAKALLAARTGGDPVAVSKQMAAITHMPVSATRRMLEGRAYLILLKVVSDRCTRGDATGALAIVWPMISSQAKVPTDADVLKDVKVGDGWLANPQNRDGYQSAVGMLNSIGAATRFPSTDPSGLGYWLASKVLAATPSPDSKTYEQALAISKVLESAKPNPDRKTGDVLSGYDEVQRDLLLWLASQPLSAQQQRTVVGSVLAQVDRYGKAGDLKTGLTRFLWTKAGDDKAGVEKLDSLLDSLPQGTAHFELLTGFASRFAKLGQEAFNKSRSAVLLKAVDELNASDSAALQLYGIAQTRYPNVAPSAASAIAVIDRYANAQKWKAAGSGYQLFYKGDGDASNWARINLFVRKANSLEDKLLFARRSLGAELSADIKQQLALIVMAVNNGDDVDARRAKSVADQLIVRYLQLHRPDFADAVVATLTGEKGAKSLTAWGLWTRAALVERRANTALADAAQVLEDRSKLALQAGHKTQLAILDQLIKEHTETGYAAQAVGQVRKLARGYGSYRAFDAATSILTSFLKTHPNLTVGEQVEYEIISIALSKAQYGFDKRDTQVPPTQLSAEYIAAIDALTKFLNDHPTSELAKQAEESIFTVGRIHGDAGAWNVTRDVLKRFNTAIPNFRSPAYLKFLEGMTFLGELDAKHGLSLLSPNPIEPAVMIGNETGFAVAGAFDDDRKDKDLIADSKPGDSGKKMDGNNFASRRPAPGTPVADPSAEAASQAPGQGQAGGGGFGGFTFQNQFKPGENSGPSNQSLAMIRQSQQRQFQRIAMLEKVAQVAGGRAPKEEAEGDALGDDGERAITLPGGRVLSESEMVRQDAAADKAYEILIELAKSDAAQDEAVSDQARGQIMWLFGFFEGQMRADRSVAYINRFLKDVPNDPDALALGYQALTDQLAWIQQQQPESADQSWIEQRHEQFETARTAVRNYIKANESQPTWANQARMLVVNSFLQEANVVQGVNPRRAGGLRVQATDALMGLSQSAPDHPQAAQFPNQLFEIASVLASQMQSEAAVTVLRKIAVKFPTHALATQSLLRIAQVFSQTDPLRAVQAYQEYLSKTDGDASVPTAIYTIADQLASQQRYLEALHVYRAFVDSFPTDPRAADALHSSGKIHQKNGVWSEALSAYDRVFEEYPTAKVVAQVKLDVATCRINLGEWLEARTVYEEFIAGNPKHAQVKMATERLDVLKQLDRFQDLLADNMIDRNKDDAQFQIGKTVLTQLQNPLKAVEEFRKVTVKFPNSDVADDAQLEIGKALIAMNRLEDGRAALLQVPIKYEGSSLADDALFLIGQSFEQNARDLAGVSQAAARQQSHQLQQNLAYSAFNDQVQMDERVLDGRRGQAKQSGDKQQLDLEDANKAWRLNTSAASNLFCQVAQADILTEAETAMQLANRQDRINDAYREAVMMYSRAATEYPLGDRTDSSLLRIASIFEGNLKDKSSAIETYQRVVKLFPGTPVAEDAAWKVSQFHVEEGSFADASDSLNSFIRNYPGSRRVSEAQFARAEVLEQLGKWNDAMDAYEIFRQKFPNHDKVKLASQQITWIKTYRK